MARYKGKYSHDRLLEEREFLIRQLEKYENSHNLDSWNDCWSELAKINRLLEFNS